MAEISLSAYQDGLSQLLTEGEYEEVVAHARHILASYPKNLRAYQQLGDALCALERGQEAAEVLRRLLDARPLDFRANAQLARVYQDLGQAGAALWHAERAFDQQPNDQASIDLLRQLSFEQSGQQIERLQLTAAALARQHLRNDAPAEALEVLDAALARSPERIDLQLLRAQALWQDGQRMSAAEAATEILQEKPLSVSANRIMAELWIAERRPSDAQAYLARLEALDPYLAHQLTTGEDPPRDLARLEELDYDSLPSQAPATVNPEWLDALGQGAAAAKSSDQQNHADDAAPTATSAPADRDDVLADDEIETLFQELIADDSASDEDAAAGSVADAQDDDARAALASLEAQAMEAQAMPAQSGDVAQDLDEDLARVLQQLEADDDDDNSWVMDIQQNQPEDDESQQYIEDFDRDWLVEPEHEEAAGAPWLSAAMREMRSENEADDFDLFADDEHLQQLLNRTNDTQPIQVDDIEAWLDQDAPKPESPADAPSADLAAPDEVTLSDDDWLDEATEAASEETSEETSEEAQPLPDESDKEERQRQLDDDALDDWPSEQDPYVDWLSEDSAAAIDKELGIFSLEEQGTAEPRQAREPDPDAPLDLQAASAAETARAWGLRDESQLADFVHDDASQTPSWLNAAVPGLDREQDAEPDKQSEFASPAARPAQEFAWVSDIVEEETGEMQAIQDPIPPENVVYFRFSKPPAWLAALRAEGSPAHDGGEQAPLEAVAALSVAEDIDELELDDLTFDDYFNFDTPTDKMDVINLDESGGGINFSELGWDDYFDFDSPTEKTIAITLDEEADAVDFQELGVEDEDFDYDTPTDKMPAITLKEDLHQLDFDDIGLADDDSDQAESRDKYGGETLL